MVVLTSFSVLDERAPSGVAVRVLLVETENPTVMKSIDGDEHPLDWVGTRRVIDNEVASRRSRGEKLDRVRVIGLREDNHVTEWDV